MIANQKVKSSAISSTDFETIKCRKCLMYRKRHRDCRGAKRLANRSNAIEKASDAIGGAKTITLHRPHGVFQSDDSSIQPFELTTRKSVRALSIGIEMTLEFRDLTRKPIDQVGRGDSKTGNLEQCSDARHTPKQAIGIGNRSRRIGNGSDENGLRRKNTGQQL